MSQTVDLNSTSSENYLLFLQLLNKFQSNSTEMEEHDTRLSPVLDCCNNPNPESQDINSASNTLQNMGDQGSCTSENDQCNLPGYDQFDSDEVSDLSAVIEQLLESIEDSSTSSNSRENNAKGEENMANQSIDTIRKDIVKWENEYFKKMLLNHLISNELFSFMSLKLQNHDYLLAISGWMYKRCLESNDEADVENPSSWIDRILSLNAHLNPNDLSSTDWIASMLNRSPNIPHKIPKMDLTSISALPPQNPAPCNWHMSP